MQNSSKLIYIGVIVVVIIIIISMGMFIMKNTQNFTDKANMSLGDSNEFNNQWAVYKGKQKGSTVKMLVQKLISNAEENSDDPNMLIDIAYKAHASDDFTIINSTRKLNNVDDIKNISTEIDVKHFYTIDFIYSEDTKQITAILIKYAEKEKFDFAPDES